MLDRTVLSSAMSAFVVLVALSATAATAHAAGVLVAEPSQVSFPSALWGESKSASVTVRNGGPDGVTLGEIALFGEDVEAFGFAGGSCDTGVVLAIGETCSVDINFTPTIFMESEQHEAALLVEGAGGDEAATSLLYGSLRLPYPGRLWATSSWMLSAAPGTTSRPAAVSVRNAGEEPVEVTSVEAAQPFQVVSNDCFGYLAEDGRCSIGVTFTAPYVQSPVGPVTGQLHIGTVPAYAGGPFTLTGRVTGVRLPRSPRPGLPRIPRIAPPIARPVSPEAIKHALARVSRGLGAVVRDGPRGVLRSRVFDANTPGILRLRLDARTAGRKRVLAARTMTTVGVNVGERFRFRLTKAGRRLLTADKAVRLRTLVSFNALDAGQTFKKATEVTVQPRLEKSKRR